MSNDPFLITGPANISFSGGRTSAYMLKRILDAHGGKLPNDVLVLFCNTGKEREETLVFVNECATRWNVPVVWLEYRFPPTRAEVVTFQTASRNGEPFDDVIKNKQRLPSHFQRFCTQELKVRTMRRYLTSLGWKKWNDVIGLRYDEGHRVLKTLAAADKMKGERGFPVMPLSKGKVTKRDVIDFWSRNDFDLGFTLNGGSVEGNCDLCFLKGKRKLTHLIASKPELADWWIERERRSTEERPSGKASTFSGSISYSELLEIATKQSNLFAQPADEEEEWDAECGHACGSDVEGW